MEYEGAGSFWSQLAMTADDTAGSAFVPRKIDELLKNPSSSLYDLMLDQEAISEFRSGNQKLVSRLTEVDGMDMLVHLICGKYPSDQLSIQQRLQLPFTASELVACELDAMLDAFTRVIPGHRTPLDQLFDFIIEGTETNPTVLGYVVRVLLVLINRRVAVIDNYIREHHDAISDALLDLTFDRSIADLLFRLCLDDDIKAFRLDFNGMISRMNSRNSDNIFWLIDSIFGRPLLGNNDKVHIVFGVIKEDLVGKNGLREFARKILCDDVAVSTATLDMLSVFIQYCFTRPEPQESGGNTFSEISTPANDLASWEGFGTSSTLSSRTSKSNEDSCAFDDDEVMTGSPGGPTDVSPGRGEEPTTFTELGFDLIETCIPLIGNSSFTLDHASKTHSFLRLLSRIIKYNVSKVNRVDPKYIADVVTASIFRYPKSSAIHNCCRDCILNDSLFVDELDTIQSIFVPKAIEYLKSVDLNEGGPIGHVCRILWFLDITSPTDSEVVTEAINRWKATDTRLADREKQVPSRVPSPQGVTPIIDLEPAVGDGWATSIDFSPSFPSNEESLSPQVRFAQPSSLTELSSSTDSWNSGIVDDQ
jgi:hypothetical protein